MASKGDRKKDDFAETVGRKSDRRMQAARRKSGLWFGIGMFGLVGWSVAVPTLLMLALGVWIDSRWDTGYSWTLMLLTVGIVLGCLNAWYWIRRESGQEEPIRRKKSPDENTQEKTTEREPWKRPG